MTFDRACLSKVIHCFLPVGRASHLIERLKSEQGIACAFAHHARGGGIGSKKGLESFHYLERDIVTLLAPVDRADEVFEFVYRAAGLNEPHAGMVLMENCLLGSPTVPIAPSSETTAQPDG